MSGDCCCCLVIANIIITTFRTALETSTTTDHDHFFILSFLCLFLLHPFLCFSRIFFSSFFVRLLYSPECRPSTLTLFLILNMSYVHVRICETRRLSQVSHNYRRIHEQRHPVALKSDFGLKSSPLVQRDITHFCEPIFFHS